MTILMFQKFNSNQKFIINVGEDKYCAFIRENYNYIVLESKLKWSKWEPNYEDFQPELPDKAIAWARDLGMGVRGHCLFWAKNVSGHFPDWVVALKGEEMKKAIYHRLDTAVPHYDVSEILKCLLFHETD